MMRSGGFNPASLFGPGIAGDAWIPEREFSFTRTVGGVYEPVTTTGDQVARLTGMVNEINIDQLTVAARPSYNEGSGLTWLAFDGVDDSMRTANGVLNVADVSMLIAISRTTEIGRCLICLPHTAASHTSPFFRLSAYVVSGNDILPRINGYRYFAEISVADNARSVIFVSNRKDVQVNGVIAPNAVTPEALTFPNSVPLIISGNATGGEMHEGNFYGAVVPGKDMTFDEINSTTAYLAGKAGITL